MNHRGFDRRQIQREANSFSHRTQRLAVRRLVPCRLPVTVPDAAFVEARPSQARAGAVQTASAVKRAPVNIGHGQMRQVQIVDTPRGRIEIAVGRRRPLLALAEENQLKAVALAVLRLQVAGVIPPFGAEVRVIEMIARKPVAIPRQRLTKIECGGPKQRTAHQAYRQQSDHQLIVRASKDGPAVHPWSRAGAVCTRLRNGR